MAVTCIEQDVAPASEDSVKIDAGLDRTVAVLHGSVGFRRPLGRAALQFMGIRDMTTVSLARTPDQIRACFAVARQLRPHLSEDAFVQQVARQQAESGYELIVLTDDESVAALAGFRIAEYLAWGRAMYVDDLITDERRRRRGYAQQLFDWLMATARARGCTQFHLNSGVHRFDAHRFYLNNRLRISSHHFSMEL